MIWTIKINSALGKGKVFGGGCIKLQSFGMVYYTAVNNKTIEKSAAAAAAAAKLLQSCPTLCDPIDGSPPGSPALGLSRQEYWSGLLFPSPVHESESENEVAQSCPTLRDPMDCSLPGSSVHGIFQARVLEWGAIAFSVEKSSFLYFSCCNTKENRKCRDSVDGQGTI